MAPMSSYISDTEQIHNSSAWTFAGLAVDESGSCYAAERKGLRNIKPKGLIVRYPNPFAGGGQPELLYKSSDPFQHLWRAPGGRLHVLGNKKYHFEVEVKGKSKFKTKAMTKPAQRMVRIRGFGDRLILAFGWPDAYVELVEGEPRPLEIGLGGHCEDIAGTGPDDIYVSSTEGIVHFDGERWQSVPDAPEAACLLCMSRDEVYATGRDPEQGKVFAVYRGNAREGFRGILRTDALDDVDDLNRIFAALGAIYLVQTHGQQRGLYRLRDGGVEKVMSATSLTGRVAGNDDLLWIENGIELLCFDGSQWLQVPRVDALT